MWSGYVIMTCPPFDNLYFHLSCAYLLATSHATVRARSTATNNHLLLRISYHWIICGNSYRNGSHKDHKDRGPNPQPMPGPVGAGGTTVRGRVCENRLFKILRSLNCKQYLRLMFSFFVERSWKGAKQNVGRKMWILLLIKTKTKTLNNFTKTKIKYFVTSFAIIWTSKLVCAECMHVIPDIET